MFDVLKTEVATLVRQSIDIRQKERHYLTNARELRGIYPKKHGLDPNGKSIYVDNVEIRVGERTPLTPRQVRKMEARKNLKDRKQQADRDHGEWWGLQHFRKNVIRKRARALNLALAFLRGKAALDVERIKRENPDWDEIFHWIEVYSEEDAQILAQRFQAWKDAGNYPPLGKKKKEAIARQQWMLAQMAKLQNENE